MLRQAPYELIAYFIYVGNIAARTGENPLAKSRSKFFVFASITSGIPRDDFSPGSFVRQFDDLQLAGAEYASPI
jgi:hypothetical protein